MSKLLGAPSQLETRLKGPLTYLIMRVVFVQGVVMIRCNLLNLVTAIILAFALSFVHLSSNKKSCFDPVETSFEITEKADVEKDPFLDIETLLFLLVESEDSSPQTFAHSFGVIGQRLASQNSPGYLNSDLSPPLVA